MKTLNKHQAKAIADALAALNNVGGAIVDKVLFPERIDFTLYHCDRGCGVSKDGRTVEEYETIHDFLVAYEVA